MPFECKAVTYTTNASPLTLKTVSLPVEQKDGQFVVGENDILVKVHYAALNPVDSILKNSAYGWLSKSEKGFGKDFSGDKIFKNGTLSEYTLVNAFDMSGKATTKIPDEMPYDKAAAFPLVLGTAHQMFESASAKPAKQLPNFGGASIGKDLPFSWPRTGRSGRGSW
ncbi:zinc ion binding [Clavispora lusitaniae]|nr:zinc ion binding [Clavispora lusitaniae]